MNFAGLFFLMAAHYFCGRGTLRLFGLKETALITSCLSLAVGVFIISLVPCLLQLSGITISVLSVATGIAIITALFCLPLFVKIKRPSFKWPPLPPIYEWPFLAAILLLALISIWRCYYYPPTARDMLTGPELLAEYTVREGTMANSVYSIDLSTTNNYFKSPFITGMQIVYKLLVCPFGQLWLSVLFVSFTIWIYTLLRRRLHPLLAGFLGLLFVATPTLYGYTYIMLYDYSNMVFFLLGYYFFIENIDAKGRRVFLFAAILFGIATYIRTETLVLIAMLLPLLLFYLRKNKWQFKEISIRSILFIMIPAAYYFVCMNVFISNFVPVHFDLHGQFNTDFSNVSILFRRLADITQLVLSDDGVTYYGFIAILFLAVLLVDIVWTKKFNRDSVMLLYGILVVFVGLAVLGYLFPSVVDIANTTKRGLFKVIALMVLYLSSSSSVKRLSDFVDRMEIKIDGPRKSSVASQQ